jgi:hypothetical protein
MGDATTDHETRARLSIGNSARRSRVGSVEAFSLSVNSVQAVPKCSPTKKERFQ